jgi:peptide/nickel transport system ATP-binding protein
MLLEAINIHKTFPPEEGRRHGRHVLRGASIALDAGESAAVIGPSGAGKTTLALVLAGLLAFDKGRVRFEGKNAWSGPGKQTAATHRRIQLVSQHPETAFDPLWTLGKSLRETGVFHKPPMPATRRDELLERFHLSPALLERLPGQLSGGELQRFALIRALSMNPAALILDEPSAMLDAFTQAQAMSALRKLAADSGTACLLISHNFRLVRFFCDTTWELKDGSILPFIPHDGDESGKEPAP